MSNRKRIKGQAVNAVNARADSFELPAGTETGRGRTWYRSVPQQPWQPAWWVLIDHGDGTASFHIRTDDGERGSAATLNTEDAGPFVAEFLRENDQARTRGAS